MYQQLIFIKCDYSQINSYPDACILAQKDDNEQIDSNISQSLPMITLRPDIPSAPTSSIMILTFDIDTCLFVNVIEWRMRIKPI